MLYLHNLYACACGAAMMICCLCGHLFGWPALIQLWYNIIGLLAKLSGLHPTADHVVPTSSTGFITPLASIDLRECVVHSGAIVHVNSDVTSLVVARASVYLLRIGCSGGVCGHVIRLPCTLAHSEP